MRTLKQWRLTYRIARAQGWKKTWLKFTFNFEAWLYNFKPNPDKDFPWMHFGVECRVPKRWIKRHLAWLNDPAYDKNRYLDGKYITKEEVLAFEQLYAVPDMKDHTPLGDPRNARVFLWRKPGTGRPWGAKEHFASYDDLLKAQQVA